MKLIAQVKLIVKPGQSDTLKRTIRTANAACDSISEWAWVNQTFGQFAIHKGVYYATKESSGLTSQMIVRCISKVTDAYKLDKQTQRTFRKYGAIAYDDRILRWYVDKGEVSIWTVDGRLKLPFACGEYQRRLLTSQQGETDLVFVDGEFYLLAVCNVDEAPLINATGVLGVDLGIVEIATDSEGKSYSGAAVKAYRRRLRALRSGLQKCGSKSAKRHLKRVNRKAAHYSKWVNHNISKQIVQTALSSRKALAIEDLKGIRERATGFNREMRWQMGNWAFDQLRQYLAYKAQRVGVPIISVDPRNSSRTCSSCGYCDKANRKSQAQFLCLQCGLQVNADLNAALNLEARGVNVRHPNVAPACG